MLTAVLYIRVSTDEQALKGYSQRNQAERLQSFCTNNNIEIIQTIFEDHSAKNFNRPEWSKLILSLNQYKSARPNLLLFTRWDRFSRNTADAYYVITQLQKLNIEPQAIEQPLDMSIPENKVLLAMYIVTAEVENDRRSLNVKYGIHKAKQEGRWIGHAPIGFINKCTESGKKIIAPYEPDATLIRKAFTRIAEQNNTIRKSYQLSITDGLKCSLSAFWKMLRNPVYYGWIRASSLNGETEYVKGTHESLISEELFNQVQNILNNRKRQVYINQPVNSLLLLRGFLYCPKCSRKLSGSGSKGRNNRYYYYHCYSPCNYRIRADKINNLFLREINKLNADPEYVILYKKVLQDSFKDIYNKKVIDQSYITSIIEKLIDRITKARELLSKGNIDSEDYLAIKYNCEQRINILGTELHNAYSFTVSQKVNLDQAAMIISQLGNLYEHADLITKRKLLNLLLTRNLIYDETLFCRNLNIETQIIYSLYSPNSHFPCIEQASKEKINPISSLDESLIQKITAIQQRKGKSINFETSKSILQYLRVFANISHSLPS